MTPADSGAAGITLKEYVDVSVKALQDQVEARLDAADKAVELGHQTLTVRLEHANGAFAQMREQSADFARKPELSALAQRIEALERSRSRHEGAGEGRQPLVSMGMVAATSIISAIVAFAAAKLV